MDDQIARDTLKLKGGLPAAFFCLIDAKAPSLLLECRDQSLQDQDDRRRDIGRRDRDLGRVGVALVEPARQTDFYFRRRTVGRNQFRGPLYLGAGARTFSPSPLDGS